MISFQKRTIVHFSDLRPNEPMTLPHGIPSLGIESVSAVPEMAGFTAQAGATYVTITRADQVLLPTSINVTVTAVIKIDLQKLAEDVEALKSERV